MPDAVGGAYGQGQPSFRYAVPTQLPPCPRPRRLESTEGPRAQGHESTGSACTVRVKGRNIPPNGEFWSLVQRVGSLAITESQA